RSLGRGLGLGLGHGGGGLASAAAGGLLGFLLGLPLGLLGRLAALLGLVGLGRLIARALLLGGLALGDGADGGADFDLIALGCAVGKDACGGGGDLHGDLVGLEFQHGLVAV